MSKRLVSSTAVAVAVNVKPAIKANDEGHFNGLKVMRWVLLALV